MKPTYFRRSMLSVAITCALSSATVLAADEEPVELDTYTAEDVVDDINLLPTEPVDSVFGFNKTLLDTPRSAATISIDTIDAFGISDIDDLVVLSPGAFTQSFFGVAGSLDVRGTPGETYFRGIRRLDNPGNYPTPIGASNRIDIVRGPASPIAGPAKIGGYLNFVPKAARAETGQYLEEPTGEFSLTRGSWDKNIITAEVGGPSELFGKKLGYYIYAETENSGSYYQNTQTDQNVFQAAFNMDLTEKSRIEFGGMYHEYDGNQVAGWNRLSQDLIDNGTYVTGNAQPADANGDGVISHQEYDLIGFGQFYFLGPESVTDANLPSQLALVDVGTAKLDASQVLVAPEDQLVNDVTTLYFDYIYQADSGLKITNKLFYEAYENLNENAYGFSQFHDSWVIEDQVIFEYQIFSDGLTTNLQFSPSVRYTDFKHGDDFNHEYFDRRDLTGPSTALDKRLLATQIDADYDNYTYGNYLDFGLALMADFTFDFGLGILVGLRQDYLDVESEQDVDKLYDCTNNSCGVVEQADDTTDGLSWTLSVSYSTPFGITPYITASEQTTVVAGQGAEIDTGNIADGQYFDKSELLEAGIKGSLVDDTLFFAASYFEMERTDYNAQSITTNESAHTEGVELEMRYVVNNNLSLTAAYTNIEVTNQTIEESGINFSFFGANDLVNVTDKSLAYGGVVNGFLYLDGEAVNKAGVPENSYSLSALYDFKNGLRANVSLFHADEAASGQSRAVILPSYTLVNAGVSYSSGPFTYGVTVKNLTDEKYFRANFAGLFGSTVVLPELPRSYTASVSYSF